MASKRQTTMAKLAREQAARERRARKLLKREARLEAAAAKKNAVAATPDPDGGTDSPSPDDANAQSPDDANAQSPDDANAQSPDDANAPKSTDGP